LHLAAAGLASGVSDQPVRNLVSQLLVHLVVLLSGGRELLNHDHRHVRSPSGCSLPGADAGRRRILAANSGSAYSNGGLPCRAALGIAPRLLRARPAPEIIGLRACS